MSAIFPLRTLLPGQEAEIVKVTVNGPLGRRIRDMGLVPGKTVQIIGKAPLRDPVELKLTDFNLTLRNNEADHILVKPVEDRK
jgi:ferrous iron transport protein A